MPRKKKSKSQAIRDMLVEHPEAKVKEIIGLLATKGIKVKPQLVYMVKGRLSQIRHHKKRKAARVAKAAGKNHDAVGLILKVKALAKEAGGIESLKQLVGVPAE